MNEEKRVYNKLWYQENKGKRAVLDSAYYKKHRDRKKIMHQRARLKLTYGITQEQYDKMFTDQGGCCFICGTPQSELNRVLAVDHDHSCCPGKKSCGKCVRWLLCGDCNPGLGYFKDSPEILRMAASSIEQWKLKRSK